MSGLIVLWPRERALVLFSKLRGEFSDSLHGYTCWLRGSTFHTSDQ